MPKLAIPANMITTTELQALQAAKNNFHFRHDDGGFWITTSQQ